MSVRAFRHVGRILAFQTLFELSSRPGRLADEVVRERTGSWTEENGEDVPDRSESYARTLVAGTLAHREEIDARIARTAPAFPVAQLPATDRVVLELAIQELEYERDAPVGAVINEAVEIAKTYGGENSGRFVNGVLGTIAEELKTTEGSGNTRRPRAADSTE